MTFYPSKKRQKQFVKMHLNNGSFPDDELDYRNEIYHQDQGDHACFDAMWWLDENNIETLAEAWDKCPRADWLAWMFARMEPSVSDARKWYKFSKSISGFNSRYYKKRFEKVKRLNKYINRFIEDLGSFIARNSEDSANEVREVISNPWEK
jgi:hypothetical protein